MGKLDDATHEVAQATTEVAAAVDQLRREIQARLPITPPEPRGYVSDLRPTRALATGLALCRDVDSRTSLAGEFKAVPPDYVDEQDGTVTVRCVCGETHERTGLHECGCGRFFDGDGPAVWAAKLPKAEPYVRPRSVPRPPGAPSYVRPAGPP